MNSYQTIVFILLIISMISSSLLFARFLKILQKLEIVDETIVEDLSQLLISGSGGMKAQSRAMTYMLGRKYASLGDKATVRAGDYALTSLCISTAFVIVAALSMSMK